MKNEEIVSIILIILGIFLLCYSYKTIQHFIVDMLDDGWKYIISGLLFVTFAGFGGNYLISQGYKINKQMNFYRTLDGHSYGVFGRMRGLMFYSEALTPETIRYLLDLGIIERESFPDYSFGYNLTEKGKKVLNTKLNIKLYPDILVELYRIRFWRGHREPYWGCKTDPFEEKKKEFSKKWGMEFDTALSEFINKIPGNKYALANKIIEKENEALKKQGKEERKELKFNYIAKKDIKNAELLKELLDKNILVSDADNNGVCFAENIKTESDLNRFLTEKNIKKREEVNNLWKLKDYEDNLNLLNKYLQYYFFENVMQWTVTPWLEKLKEKGARID